MNDYVRGAVMALFILFMNITVFKYAINSIMPNKVYTGSKSKRFFGFVQANLHIFLFTPVVIGCNVALINFVMRMWKI